MFDIPPKTHDFEVIPSNNSSLSKRYTIKVGYKYYDRLLKKRIYSLKFVIKYK